MFQNKIQVHVYTHQNTITDRSYEMFKAGGCMKFEKDDSQLSMRLFISHPQALMLTHWERLSWKEYDLPFTPGPWTLFLRELLCTVDKGNFRFSRYCKWYFIQQIVGPWFSQILECKHEKCATPGAGTGELAWGGCTRPPASWCQLSCSPGAWSADVLVRLVLMC